MGLSDRMAVATTVATAVPRGVGAFANGRKDARETREVA